jgi:hypothetical protein
LARIGLDLLFARPHRLLVLPGGRPDAATGGAIDQQGNTLAPLHCQEGRHQLVAKLGDAAVNR